MVGRLQSCKLRDGMEMIVVAGGDRSSEQVEKCGQKRLRALPVQLQLYLSCLYVRIQPPFFKSKSKYVSVIDA